MQFIRNILNMRDNIPTSVISSFLVLVVAGLISLLPPTGESAAGTDLEDIRDKTLIRVLDNGMKVILTENRATPITALKVYVNIGSIYEKEFLGCGISHYFEHVLAGGTTSRHSEEEYNRWKQEIGAFYNAYTTFDHTCYYITTGSSYADEALAMLSEWIMFCSFDSSEVAREKGVILQEILTDEMPRRKERLQFRQLCYLNHPIRHPIIGYSELFKTITYENIINFYERFYIPNNMFFVAAGDFDRFRFFEKVKEAFSGFERKSLEAAVLPDEPAPVGERRMILEMDVTNPILKIAWPSVDIFDSDSYTLDVLSEIFGGGKGSRLHKTLVEEKKLVSSISSFNWTPGYVAGYFSVSAQVLDSDSVPLVEETIIEEIKKLQAKGVKKRELESAKRGVLSATYLGLESTEGLAGNIGRSFIHTRDPFFDLAYCSRFSNVSRKMIRTAARKYFDPEKQVVMITYPEGESPASRITAQDETTPASAHAAIPRVGRSDQVEKSTGVPAGDVSGGAESPGLKSPFHVDKYALEGGTVLLHRYNPSVPTAALAIFFKGGLVEETAADIGLTTFMVNMLREGAGNRDADEITGILDSRGIKFTERIHRDSFSLRFRFLAEDMDVVAELLGDMACSPLFPEEKVELKRSKLKNDIEKQKDDPYTLSDNFFQRTLYSDHPYGFSRLGTKDNLDSFTRQDLFRWFERAVSPDRMIISLSGDLTGEEAKNVADRIVAKIIKGRKGVENTPLAPPVPLHDFETGVVRVEEDVYPHPQVEMHWGFPTVEPGHPDYYPLKIITALFSGNNSRLHNALRGDADLVYFVFGYQDVLAMPSAFIIHTQTSIEKRSRVRELVESELERLKREQLDPETLARLKKEIEAELPLIFETNAEIAGRTGYYYAIGQGHDYLDRLVEGINGVTSESVQAAAVKYFSTGVLAISRPSTE